VNGRSFTWLHLTDLHAGGPAHLYLWPNVEDEVFKDLASLHEKIGSVDAIFFTGDLTQTGKLTDFERFDACLERLLGRLCEFGSDPRFFAVPGNHDVNRPEPTSGVVALAKDWQGNFDLREHFYADATADLRKGIDQVFSGWTTRLSQHRRQDSVVGFKEGLLPGDFSATLEVDSIRVGIVGLNTAFLQLYKGNLKGRLTLDLRQLHAVCPEGGPAWSRSHDVTFLLTHHPPDWLDEAGLDALRTEIAPPGRFSMHLYGHLHEPRGPLVSWEGAAQSRQEALGRSLFGLEHWGEDEKRKRLHGYSAGEVSFDKGSRMLRLWPRKGERIYAGGWQVVPDYGYKLDENESLVFPELGPSPRDVAVHRGSTAPAPIRESSIPGWMPVDIAFLEEHRVELSAASLRQYFDGAVPRWAHAISEEIPRRHVVGGLLRDLRSSLASGIPRVHLIIGPAGEGKSTVLLQAAADVASDATWRVLWRPDVDTELDAGDVRGLPAGPWLLVSDDADRIAGSLFAAWRAALHAERSDIYFLVAARDTDWRDAKGDGLTWGDGLRRFRLRHIDHRDAREIVRAWARVGEEALGELAGLTDEEERAEALVSASSEGAPQEASFFGGILRTRFSAEGLRLHVHELMSRLDEREVRSDRTLRDAFLEIAALDAAGIEGIDRRVLASSLSVPFDRVWTEIIRPLGEEAAAVHAGELVRSRHLEIARASIAIAERSGTAEDLADLYARVVRETIATSQVTRVGVRGWHGSVVHMGPRLVKNLLQEDFSLERRAQIAVAASEAAVMSEPQRLSFRVTFARTWRAAEEPAAGIEVLRNALPALDEAVDYEEVRGFWYEWAVCAGNMKDSAANAVLAGLSISDFLNPVPISVGDAEIRLAGLGMAFKNLVDLCGDDVYLRGLRAVAGLGSELVRASNAPGTDYFSRHERWANELGADQPDDFDEAVEWLREATRAAGNRFEDRELCALFDPSTLTFEALAALLR
jgi:hypothetical protein